MSLIVDRMPELGVTRLSRWIFNCYVLDGDDGPVVVDPGSRRISLDVTTLLGKRAAGLRAVVATHGHTDHVGGAPSLAAMTGADVHVAPATIEYTRGARPPSVPSSCLGFGPVLLGQPFDGAVLRSSAADALRSGYGTPLGWRWTGPDPVGDLTDDAPVPGASEWIVVDAPGHTPDSVALWHAGTRTLLAGDAIATARGRALFAPITFDKQHAPATSARLRGLPAEHLLPGHGLPLHTPAW
ncbi:MBL fold metallo-hydrolase [Tsukamurella sp. 8F]|uniref:MBL fold metallo-hydrolase n=1 Tax=unclassified Tsukamurella TaxID=2633480 RepID=UPI0023BA398B|nr:MULTISPECIES: MBL fold metallo-hydrolase [unclassified Tsukamurella]MDF0531568.1 MBL fold metallo-hydrolase [Tsukamurella sp. 8J]MDF0587585.1 MBL fold metallo-hydrolase [Tsukamurella sp. 8F]